jgi:DNA polymerase III epsilon subunit family exonuclease
VDWVAFDTETTGLGSGARLVEIGARRFCADGTVWDFETLVDPEMPIPAVVQRIHGISDEMVRGAPKSRAALDRFFSFAEGAALVAHNARFDMAMLRQDAARNAMPLPSLLVHDSVRLARRMLPHLWSYRLANVARQLHITSATWHRALADAVVVGELVKRLLPLGSMSLLGFPLWSAGLVGRLDEVGVPERTEIGQGRVGLPLPPASS